MKKYSEINNIVFNCLSCNNKYKTISVHEKSEDINVDLCLYCSPFYTGKISSSNIGNVEKFRRKMNKFSNEK